MVRIRHPRPRWRLSQRWARVLPRVGFRYDGPRDAFILWAGGERLGPVFVLRGKPQRVGQRGAAPPDEH
jgi:hypothetical protein